jgi:1-acyl-sn-glycerol-3-phosphate acyltransferase
MRVLLKWLALIPLLLTYLTVSGIVRILPAGKKMKRRVAIRATALCSRSMLMLFGIRLHVKHRERLGKGSDIRLIISNHLSYIDVFVLSSLLPSVFITSVELKNTAFLGALAGFAGSLFVERRKAGGLKKEIESVAFVLGQGFPVVLFPEGTTSNGDRVQEFKNSLFDSAVVTRADIIPVCLRYTRVNGERITPRNRDAVYYYGGVTFFKHFPKLLSRQSVDVEVLLLKAVKVHPHHTRKDLAEMTRNAIAAAYHSS